MALVSICTLFMSTAPLTPFLNCLSLRRFQHIRMRQPQQASIMSRAATPIQITPQYGTIHTKRHTVLVDQSHQMLYYFSTRRLRFIKKSTTITSLILAQTGDLLDQPV